MGEGVKIDKIGSIVKIVIFGIFNILVLSFIRSVLDPTMFSWGPFYNQFRL